MGRSSRSKKHSDDFAILEPRIKHVAGHTVRKNWKKLPLSSHAEIQELIATAKEQSGQRKGRGGIYRPTEDCVQEAADKLTQRLTRIPFPPKTEDSHFDHEANLHRICKVEEQLTLNIHSMRLLRAQILQEEKQLKQQEAELEYLERSLQSNEVFRRQQSKTLHPIARSLMGSFEHLDPLLLEEQNTKGPDVSVSDLFQDHAMKPVLQLLLNHLDNMDNNIVDIARVSRAAQTTGLRLQSFTSTTSNKRKSNRAAG